MNRNYVWKVFFVVFLMGICIAGMYPPVGENLIHVFKRDAVSRDVTFTNIVTRAEELQKEFPERTFANLKDAVGTNYITNYFPRISTAGKKDPTRHVLQRLQQEASGKFRLGLDLQGGTSFLLEMDTSALADTNALTQAETRDMVLERAIEVLRNRVDQLGVAEPLIQPAGGNKILIQLPGLAESDKQSARENIQRAAFLEFRMVHPDSDELLAQNIIEPGYEVLRMESKNKETGQIQLIPYLVKKKAERGLTGKYLKRAMVSRHHITNEPEIQFELDGEGAKLFGDITREFKPVGNKFYQLAIVLDGQLYSAPRINEPIEGGRGQITGNFDLKEAITLANVLENPLEAPVRIIEERAVDPSLGKDSINSGLKAAVVGTIAVAAFMALYYLLAGIIANVALILNILVLLGLMCWLKATLTLPGIAGIVLTAGMAVDANVLIFERIREELQAGKSLRGALAAGYNKAFGTILDSNLTTLISAVILYYLGTGPVKGFGVTLAIGLGTSMFTALVVTRLIFDFLVAKNIIKSLPMLQFIKPTNIDFLKWAKPAFVASWLLILVGIGFGIKRGNDVMGVDFAGGDSLTLAFEKKVDQAKVRDVINDLKIGDALVNYQKEMTGGKETLTITSEYNSGDKVEKALTQSFPDAKFTRVALDKVGPSVGAEILKNAIVATLLAMFGILVYVAFRYEFSFAVGATIAIVHDVLMTMGWFFLTGRELSASMVAAILTIIGFSINDTIVIFDRIREDLKLGVRGSFKDVMNIAINQTLSRTIITSGTVLIATLALYFLGGTVINDFAFTFLVGILTGTYSTIFIASAIVLWWNKGQRPKVGGGSTVRFETAVEPRDQTTAPARA
jgi:SecD/SecF fusion protein